ncbi:MAG: VWA domain-containing protein [Phycisphaeraceae bacterium]|nr:VWA domain-containing protein [Phycisphaeraceae bacterium]
MTLSLVAITSSVPALVVGPLQLDRPLWLGLAPILAVLVVWIGRHSLAGLESATRWIALGIRLIVIAALCVVLAEPFLRREAKDVAVIVVLDASRSISLSTQADVDRFVEAAGKGRHTTDRLGIVTVAADSYVQALPSRLNETVERRTVGSTEATNLAGGARLGMAVAPEDAAVRMLIASDGNETVGSLLSVAQSAVAAGVPVDVLPIRYRYPKEVILDRVLVPATARKGQVINVRIVLTATAPTRGLVFLAMDGEEMDLNPEEPSNGVLVELDEGVNIHTVQILATSEGAKRFRARFEPLVVGGERQGDELIENNVGLGVTFVAGEGRILVIRESPDDASRVIEDLAATRLAIEQRRADEVDGSLEALASYDGVIIANEPAPNLSVALQQNLVRYVHDLGGGILMIGGPDAYGAGGWIGSPVAEALPVRLDPPTEREMPRGALVLIMHSIEMPQGVYYGKQVAGAAVDALSSQDLVGIIEYNPMSAQSESWVHPLSMVGDRSAVRRSINNLAFGDMPSFNPSLRLALSGLETADAGQKHVIVISDGDPSLSRSILDSFKASRITISAVGVNPHSPGDLGTMRLMAQATGGRFHSVSNSDLDEVIKIFIKEAQIIRRSLIWEGQPIPPRIIASGSDAMRQISGVPPISGYVVTADREGLSLVTMRIGKENDPLLAQWQYGLGRVVCYTSDATSRWNAAWMSWPDMRRFWDQHVRWMMRPVGSATMRIVTEDRGEQTLVRVEALDDTGERLATGVVQARASAPDGSGVPLDLRQTGPGLWEGSLPTGQSGTYVLAARVMGVDSEGQPDVKGAAQAAIVRPFADEFRDLEDNAALLAQVADMTGGRIVNINDPGSADLWRREGLTMPVATRAIWIQLAIAAMTLFLLDVAVRRVRIEPAAILAAFRRGLHASKDSRAGDTQRLREARAGAQQRIAAKRHTDSQPAKRTYEPSAEAMAKQPSAPIALSGEAETADQARERAKRARRKEETDGMSRLMAAKRRAREGLDEDQDKK